MGEHSQQAGRHRDPLDRRRKHYEAADPEVLGVPISQKQEEEKKKGK